MRGRSFFDSLLKNEYNFYVDFTTFCSSWLHGQGYKAVFDKQRIIESHRDWVTLLSCWGAETVVRSSRNGTIEPEKRVAFLEDANQSFFGAALNSSEIKRAGCLLSCLVDSQPIAALFRHQKSTMSNVVVLGDERPPNNVSTTPNGLLEAAPSEFLSFLYCWDRFFEILRNRTETKALTGAEAPPMTLHYLQNMVTMLYTRNYTPTSLYMIFKSFDLFAMEHEDSPNWGKGSQTTPIQ